MSGYELSRVWFDWCFENPEKVSPNHTAIYFFALEHQNRLGGKEKFGFPSQMTMEALGIKKHQTYIKYFNDLIEWGFINLIQKSTNQYSANIISINKNANTKNGKAIGKALDKAFIKHGAKQTESIGQSNGSIDKQGNKEQENKEKESLFESLWLIYPTKTDKKLSKERFMNLSKPDIELVKTHLPIFAKNKPFETYKHPHFSVYLSKERYKDEMNPQETIIKQMPKIQQTFLTLSEEEKTEMRRLSGLID